MGVVHFGRYSLPSARKQGRFWNTCEVCLTESLAGMAPGKFAKDSQSDMVTNQEFQLILMNYLRTILTLGRWQILH